MIQGGARVPGAPIRQVATRDIPLANRIALLCSKYSNKWVTYKSMCKLCVGHHNQTRHQHEVYIKWPTTQRSIHTTADSFEQDGLNIHSIEKEIAFSLLKYYVTF